MRRHRARCARARGRHDPQRRQDRAGAAPAARGSRSCSAGDTEETISGTDLLVAAGRRPNIDGLDLDAARVKHEPAGIVVNRKLRTSNRRVYAIGDVIGAPQFTHAANHQAALLRPPRAVPPAGQAQPRRHPARDLHRPGAGPCRPDRRQARAGTGAIRVLRWPYHENDRAQTEGETRGHIKVVTNRKGLILGATIVGAAAGELIVAWTLAISHGLNIRVFCRNCRALSDLSEIGKRAAIGFFTPRLTRPWVRRILGLLRRFG